MMGRSDRQGREARSVNIFNEAFQQRLYYLRTVTKRSQKQVADYCELERSTYSCYELGRSHPSLATLVRLSRLYEVSTDYLLGVGNFDDDKGFAYRFQFQPKDGTD